MLTYEDALARILKITPSPRAVTLRLDRALGLVLARPVTARLDLPRFDNSAVDGYALRVPDQVTPLTGAAVALPVIGHAGAGRPFRGVVREQQAVRILTGAQVPRGANAVVMQEDTTRHDDRIKVRRRPTLGQHIRRRGEDVHNGTRLLEAGTVLRPQEIGLLAAMGYGSVPVYRRPVAAILVTGDEVRPPGARLKGGQIYESNGALLGALVQQAQAVPIPLGVVRDTLAPLVTKIRKGLAADVLLLTGGVSVGDRDFVRLAATRCGVKTVLWRVNIKPGMPLFVGTHGRTLVFGLPGNPVSVFVTFEEFVKPALSTLMGRTWRDGYTQPVTLAEDLKLSTTRRTHFIRVRHVSHNGQVRIAPVNGQGSHQLRSVVETDGWIRMVAAQGPWAAETSVLMKPTDCPR